MKKIVYLFIFSTLVCCGESIKSEADLISEVTSMEKVVNDPNATQVSIDESRLKYIESLKAIYMNYPKSDEAARSLDKLHMVFTGLGNYVTATKYCDTLINNYPKYDNRALVLESAASAYDASLLPRDSTMVRKYYTMMLDEFPKLDPEKRADIQKRLAYNKLTFEQFIQIQAADAVGE